MDRKSNNKGGSNALGFIIAGAIGLAAGFFANKFLSENKKNEEEERIQYDNHRAAIEERERIPISTNDTSRSTNTELERCEDLICPITLEIMNRPMVSKKCGHSFDQAAINQWLENRNFCPKCHVNLTKDDLIENYNLKNAIEYMKFQTESIIRQNETK